MFPNTQPQKGKRNLEKTSEFKSCGYIELLENKLVKKFPDEL